MPNPDLLQWARRLQAIAQNGLTYAKDSYDTERYSEIRQIAAQIMAAASLPAAPAEHFVKLFDSDKGYSTPKVDVRAAVFDDARILLVREREDNCWSLPGGWADIGDSPAGCALREVKEESGYDAAIKKLAAVYDRDRHGHPPIPFHAYKLFFICELVGGSAEESHETSGASFFTEANLPPLSLTRVTEEEIRQMFEHYRHPEWPTWYD